MPAPLILLVSMLAVIALIVWARAHAFLALLAGGLLVGILSPAIPADTVPTALAGHFGRVCGSIAIVIALASIIGECLLDSGAAERISRRFLRLFGEQRAHLSLWGSGYVLSVPVFFDTVFYLLLPLARAMTARTGGRYALNIMAIGAGGAATHVFVPPTPGPLAAASTLGVDLGLMILMGLMVAIPGSLLAVAYATVRDRRSPIELRTSVGMSPEELQRMVQRPDGELPGFFVSMLPITLPVIMIASRTVADAFAPDTAFQRIARFIGDANIALLASALFALWLVKVRCGLDLGDIQKRTEQGLLTAGPVILITAAGGAYGGMLQQAQIGATLQALSTSLGLPVLGLAFLLAAILKIAQGSSTVAIITTSSVLQAMYAAGALALPHPVYAALAAGAGSLVISWMNDSGFWVVGRMSGFSERETLGTWTVTAAIVGTGGFLTVLLLNAVLPLK